jgi:hypothetical protein
VLDNGVNLPDGTPVVVTIAQKTKDKKWSDDTSDREIPTLYERLKPVIGIAKDLPPEAATALEAETALEEFAQAWDAKYPTIAKQWRAKWAGIITLFDFPPAIRRAIYTTNAIESVNSAIRKLTRNRKIYPHEESALKLIFMAIREAAKKWTCRSTTGSRPSTTSPSCTKAVCPS